MSTILLLNIFLVYVFCLGVFIVDGFCLGVFCQIVDGFIVLFFLNQTYSMDL